MNRGPNHLLYGFILAILTCFSACQPEESDQPNPVAYRDLNVWVEELTEDLKGYQLRKVSTWNGLSSTVTFTEPDWPKELKPFYGIPLSPISWKSDYRLIRKERSEDGNGRIIEHYEAIDKERNLQALSLTILGGETVQMDLYYVIRNILKKSEKRLTLIPGFGYSISGRNRTLFFSPESYEIQGTFVPVVNL